MVCTYICIFLLEIIVERSAERELELEKRLLPPNIEKIIKRHAGYDYLIVNVRYDSGAGRPFGLNVSFSDWYLK